LPEDEFRFMRPAAARLRLSGDVTEWLARLWWARFQRGGWTVGHSRSTFARFVLLAVCSAAAPAFALDCPNPHTVASRGVLQETPAEIEATGKRLAGGDPEKTTSAVLADLRARYPKADGAEFVNYIITAYCPVIDAQPSLSEAEKTARLDAFVKQLLAKVY
jgi:hypothetical protein